MSHKCTACSTRRASPHGAQPHASAVSENVCPVTYRHFGDAQAALLMRAEAHACRTAHHDWICSG